MLKSTTNEKLQINDHEIRTYLYCGIVFDFSKKIHDDKIDDTKSTAISPSPCTHNSNEKEKYNKIPH